MKMAMDRAAETTALLTKKEEDAFKLAMYNAERAAQTAVDAGLYKTTIAVEEFIKNRVIKGLKDFGYMVSSVIPTSNEYVAITFDWHQPPQMAAEPAPVKAAAKPLKGKKK